MSQLGRPKGYVSLQFAPGKSRCSTNYEKVFTINTKAGSFAEDVVELKESLEEMGYTVVDKSQDGKIIAYRQEGGEE